MKLWLIKQSENNSYDTFDSAVVAAESEDQARAIHPQGPEPRLLDWGGSTWASSPEHVTAEYIGEAKEGTPAGVILASFNAG